MSKNSKAWNTYEEVAREILNKLASSLQLLRVEGKQKVKGAAGTHWEIDAKGVRDEGGAFVIVECRRYTTSRLCQEAVAGVAYRIHDTGAASAIIVSPLGLQEGAELVAAKENIVSVILSPDSTVSDFALQFFDRGLGMQRVIIADTLTLDLRDSVTITITDASGKIISSDTYGDTPRSDSIGKHLNLDDMDE